MALVDDLKTIADDLDTIKAVVEGAAANLEASPVASVGDNVLSGIVSALEAAGYTVTPPAELPETTGESQDAEDTAEGVTDATPSPDSGTTNTTSDATSIPVTSE